MLHAGPALQTLHSGRLAIILQHSPALLELSDQAAWYLACVKIACMHMLAYHGHNGDV